GQDQIRLGCPEADVDERFPDCGFGHELLQYCRQRAPCCRRRGLLGSAFIGTDRAKKTHGPAAPGRLPDAASTDYVDGRGLPPRVGCAGWIREELQSSLRRKGSAP